MKQLRDYFDMFSITDAERKWLSANSIFIGDTHNHSGISYGHGTLEQAINFAEAQLDFFSVTGHFAWPDMETTEGMEIPEDVKAYHNSGFAKLRKGWNVYLDRMKKAERPDFIPFPSWEFHSFHYGDYTVVAKHQGTPLPKDPPAGEQDLRLKQLVEDNHPEETDIIAYPHHIGYKEGYRGINWSEFRENNSKVVEIISMHGCAESHEARLSYLHTMGPRSEKNTMQGGLEQGFHFGVMGNTDHHNSAPGSYGFGRTGAYSEKLTRDGIWNSLLSRHTIAYTGDPMRMAIFANEQPLGSEVHGNGAMIDAYTVGFDAIDRFELIHDGKVVAEGISPNTSSQNGFISIAFGWGERNCPCHWHIKTTIDGNIISDASPRLRGNDVVDPLEKPIQDDENKVFFNFSDDTVDITASTDGNRTASTNGTQGFVIEIPENKGILKIELTAKWNGKIIERCYSYDIAEIKEQKTEYISGFVSPALAIGPFTKATDSASEIHFAASEKGAYYVRCYEKIGDAAYSTPVWIE